MMRTYLAHFILTLMLAAVAGLFFCWFLLEIGEANINSVVKKQTSGSLNILYNSGTHSDFYDYKSKLYEARQPSIVAIGSSRAMEVRGEFFNDSFSNWGGAVASNSGLRAIVNKISSSPKKPRLALVFVDIWWFNSNYAQSREEFNYPRIPDFPNIPTVSSALWIMGKHLPSMISLPKDRMGLMGLISNEGFDKFGSYHYTSTVTGEKTSSDIRFSDTADRIKRGYHRFEYGSTADRDLIAEFNSSIERLRSQGIYVILIFPPFSSYANELMSKTGDYGYVKDLKEILVADKIQFYDYTNLTPLQSEVAQPDCEFVDGLHGGDVAYGRVIRDIAKNDPKLRASLDNIYISNLISSNKGRAEGTIIFNKGKKEVDFLHLGCVK